MPWAIPLTGLALAGAVEWVKWGQGKLNWGPRLGALLLLLFGQVAFTGTLVGDWLRTGINDVAGWLDTWTAYLLGAQAGSAVAYLFHWLPAALLGGFWIAAMLPGKVFQERMTWRLAWAGVFLPPLVSAIPGPAGQFLTWVVHTAAGIGAAIIGALFHMKG